MIQHIKCTSRPYCSMAGRQPDLYENSDYLMTSAEKRYCYNLMMYIGVYLSLTGKTLTAVDAVESVGKAF